MSEGRKRDGVRGWGWRKRGGVRGWGWRNRV